MTKVFKFTKDVQHEPRAQMAGHRKGEILVESESDGITVNRQGDRLTLRTGHGTSDEFSIGEEVAQLDSSEARSYLRTRALSKLTAEEIDVLRD